MNRPNKYVAYYRVSTKRQGQSGLGLEAQQRAVHGLTDGSQGPLLAEYVEVETGKSAKRPKLNDAIQHAQLTNSTLVVAKLDRLARNAQFTRCLREAGVPFVCCDNPQANELTIDLLSVIAEHEAKAISVRTKEALASAKARGTLLGSARPQHWDGREQGRLRGTQNGQPAASAANAANARKRYQDVLIPEIKRRREAGETLATIVSWLNSQGFTTRPTSHRPQGSKFTVAILWRLVQRYLGAEYLGRTSIGAAT